MEDQEQTLLEENQRLLEIVQHNNLLSDIFNKNKKFITEQHGDDEAIIEMENNLLAADEDNDESVNDFSISQDLQ